jgi:hypothetical protein
LIGLISVTIINFTALFGAIILPFRNKSQFKWILSTFIGLGNLFIFLQNFYYFLIIAVGTLIGTGLFHLIPMVHIF